MDRKIRRKKQCVEKVVKKKKQFVEKVEKNNPDSISSAYRLLIVQF